MSKEIGITDFAENKFSEEIHLPKRYNYSGAHFKINPIQDFLLKRQMASSEAYARAVNSDFTSIFFDFLDYKIENRENIAIGVKGATRSGKSAGGHAICWHIADLIVKHHYPDKKPNSYFNVDNVCATESEYAYKVKDAPENSIFQIDEQREIILVNS